MLRLELITQFNIGILTADSTIFHCEAKLLSKNVLIHFTFKLRKSISQRISQSIFQRRVFLKCHDTTFV